MNSTILKLFFLLLLTGIFQHVCAQQVQKEIYKGVIRNEKNEPLPGVTVSIQEQNGSTVTNNNGEFSIEAGRTDILLFKKDGFSSVQRSVSAGDFASLTLQSTGIDAGEQDNVYIPFGVRKKRQVSAAITTVSSATIPQVPVADLKNLFSGRVAGLYLQQTNSAPGNDGTSFFIRSRNSYGSPSAKAFVDGTQREFGDMDLNEIESITVLKDAATLAWYGFRGGNGVVLVNTKKGSASDSYIRLDAQTGFQNPLHIMRPLDAYNYAQLYNEASLNDGNTTAPFNQTALNGYLTGSDPYLYPSNSFTANFLKRSSPVQRYVLTAGGGSNSVRYFALLSYYDQRGLLNQTEAPSFNSNSGFKKFNFRGNVDFDVNKYLTLTLNAGMRTENRLAPGSGLGDVLSTLYNTPPNAFPLVNPDGSLGGTAQYTSNPLGLLQQRGYTSALDRVLLATINARQKLDFWVPGLSANVLISYDGLGTYTSGISQQYSVADFSQGASKSYLTAAPVSYRAAGYSNNSLQNELWAGLDYDKSFHRHTIHASVRGQRFADKQPERLDLRNQGLSGRIDYSFNERYFFGLVAGYSGSENFAPGKRYGFFPAASAGWVISEEKFLKGSKVFNYLKFRASYGSSGNSEIGGSRFPFESFYNRNLSGGGYAFGTSFSASNSATESNLGNPAITWETIKMANAGFDIRFLQNTLGFTADVYHTRRENILTGNVLPSILGQNIGLVNAGIVESKGIDASAFYSKTIGKLTLSFNGNLLTAANKVIAENGQAGLPDYQQTIGKIPGSVLVFLSDGLFNTQAEINSSARQTLSGKVFPGDIRYRDIGGPNGMPDGVIDNNDRTRINKTDLPNTYYGFGTDIRYGIFDLSAQFQGVSGRTISIQGIVNSGPFSLNNESLDRWTPATAQLAKYPRLGIADRGNNTAASDFWLRSGDFLRLKSIQAGINLPTTLTNKYRISSCRFFIGGFNVVSFDKLDVNIDPELPGAGRGSEYPYLRTWTLGLSAKF